MKKKLSAALASTMVLGTVPAAFAATPNFVDISGSYAQQQILQLVSEGIINGEDATHFNPTGTLTRAEAAKLIVAATGLKVDSTVSSSVYFTDVNGWAAPYVDAASQAGLFNGEGNGIFDPSAPLTREQAAVVLAKALGLKVDMSALPSFTDVASISSWARAYVAAAQKAGLFNGNPDGSFGGQSPFTREQAAVVLVAFQKAYQAAQAAMVSKLSITGNGTVSVGQFEKLTAVATNAAGNAVPNAVFSWSVSGSGAVIDANGNFIASQAGTYTVTVTSGGQSATANVVVYGAAAGVTLSAATTSVVANGVYSDNITATAVDAKGNPVTNFAGTAVLTIPTAGGTFSGGTTSNGNSTVTVTFANGVATVGLVAPNTVPSSQTITSSSLVASAGSSTASGVSYSYGTLALSYVAPSATALSLSPTLNTISANSYTTSDAVTLNVNDSTGTGIGTTEYVTLTLTGPGSLQQVAAGGSAVTTESMYVNNGFTFNVYPLQGQTGPITVTATANGLTTATTTINSVVTGAASALKFSGTQGTLSNALTVGGKTLPSGTAFTLYTVQVVDANSNPVPQADAITVSDSTYSAPNDSVTYFAQSGGQPTGSALTVGAGGAVAVGTTSATTGQLQFIAVNTTSSSTPATLTAKDSVTSATNTASYAFNVGSATQVVASNGVTTYNLKAGQTIPVTLQLQDAAGNNVSQANVAVNVYFSSTGVGNAAGATINNVAWNSGNQYQAMTNANGQVTFNVVATNQAVPGFTLLASISGESSAQVTADGINGNVESLSNYTTQLGFSSALAWPTSVTGGTTVVAANVYNVIPENGVGNPSGVNDEIQVTSSNSNVISVGGAASQTFMSNANIPAIVANQAGTATVTFTDLSNPAVPAVTETISVTNGAATALKGLNPDGTTNTAYAYPSNGVAGPFTIQVVDNGGNVVPASAPTTLTVSQIQTILGLASTTGIRLNPSGSDVSSVTIGQNQSAVQVYVDNYASGASTTATGIQQMSSLAPSLSSATVSGSTVTLTFSAPVTTVPGQSVSTSTFNVVDANVTDSQTVTPVVSGNTVTLTLSKAPAHGDSVSVSIAPGVIVTFSTASAVTNGN